MDTNMANSPPPAPHPDPTDLELDEKFPHRPRNHSPTLPFHTLFLTLFNPLNANKKKPTGPPLARRKQGPHGQTSLPPHEIRRNIISRFISRWRAEVGNDIYPAFRLIVPEKDRERAMYGMKEKAIGKLLVKVMRIDKNSEDGSALLNWKLPGQGAASSRLAGDFAGRCGEVIAKRAMRTRVGDMSIGEVNELLDELAAAQREEGQIPVFERFYTRMNAEEMMWVIRIILRQMKVGATEKTVFDIWHPDADGLFNVSSSLRRVCWELWDANVRLEGEERGVALLQCFQPQLAQFQMHSLKKMVERMRPRPVEGDDEFYIEEKLDGERMQMHMVTDANVPGGKRFAWWSRKAKDYTYLYGNGFMDENSALTRHLKEAFHPRVQNIILDGEMITWDPEQDAIVPFGTLKTAALSEQRNPFSNTGQRPLFRIFDILYVNGKVVTNYTLRDRKKALEDSVRSIHRRFEIHEYKIANDVSAIEPLLRKVVAEASEGLVLKNPRSPYRLNDRNDDWMKVKPEYMTEFGESLDCVVIGGYYGSGKRGGFHSSYLCGLRVDENHIQQGANPQKCFSFFKVGGGFTAADYAAVRHRTEGKWRKWDKDRPPRDWIELAGGDLQYERPDEWIMPEDSVVVSVKASSVTDTDQFRMGFTLRFPRFKSLREDRDWKSALTIQGFRDLKANVDKEIKEKEFRVDDGRKKRLKTIRKKPITILGDEADATTPYAGPETKVFEGLNFYIITESLGPEKKSKAELEQLVKSNGGKIFQTHDARPNTLCIADRKVVRVAGLMKTGKLDIIRPRWLFDCVKQSAADYPRPSLLLPLEPCHMFFTLPSSQKRIDENIDEYGISYARDVLPEELKSILDSMPDKFEEPFDPNLFSLQLAEDGCDLSDIPGSMFHGFQIYVDKLGTSIHLDHANGTSSHDEGTPEDDEPPMLDLSESELRIKLACNRARFGGAEIVHDLDDEKITHVLVGEDKARWKEIRKQVARRKRLPRLVTVDWIEQSWKEDTLLDEERFAPR